MDTLPHSYCTSKKSYGKFPHMPIFEKSMFCAGFMEGGRDACVGDSGGALICVENEKPVIQGIISWGYKCGKPNFPGVYTRVSNYVDWVKYHIANSLPDPENKSVTVRVVLF